MVKIIECLATENLCFKRGQKMTPKRIVVHSTGCNNPNLKRYCDCPSEFGTNKYGNHWNTPDTAVCVHAFIGKDKNGDIKIAHILPYNFCCWGIGSGSKGSYNYNPAYIQFEICEDDLTDKEYFNKAFDAAVDYCVYLCKKFNLSINNIVSHHEAHLKGYGSNHGDCDHWLKKFGKDMNWFRERVKAGLAAESKPTKTTPNTAKSVKVKIVNKKSYLRSAAHLKGKTLYTLPVGAVAEYISDDNWGWSKIKYGGKLGYVQNSRISGKTGLSKYRQATVKVNGLNVRTSPTMNAKNVVKVLNKGNKFTVICINPDGWVVTNIGGKDLYIKDNRNYFSIGNKIV